MQDKVLIKLLYEKGHTYSNIARKLQISRQRVHQIVADYKNYGRADRESKYAQFVVCNICYDPYNDLHHIDGDNSNDDIKNLLPVCKKCHYELHKGKPRKINKKFPWSMNYPSCINCKTDKIKYGAKGLCAKCYLEEYRRK